MQVLRLHRMALVRFLLLLVLVSLVACGTPTPATTTTSVPTTASVATVETPPAATAASASASQINFQFFGDAEERDVYLQLVQRYMDTHPGQVVNPVSVPSQGDHMTKLAAGFTAGAPPEVFLVNYRRYGQFVKDGLLEPLGPLMAASGMSEDQYYSIALDAFRSDGVLQCVPQNISSLVVYYNKQLFEAQGLPLPQSGWTWNDFLLAGRKLTLDTNNDGVVDVHGIGVEPEIIRLAPFIWQAGGDFVDNRFEPTKFSMTDPKTDEGVQFFLNLRAAFAVVPSEAEATAEDMETRFRTGKLGMLLNSRRVVPGLRTIKDFTWDVAPLPIARPGAEPATVLHSDAYCIPKSTPNKDAAWEFIKFAAGVQGQTIASELGRTVPSLKAVAESPAFLAPDKAPANSKIFLDTIPSIRTLPLVSTWPAIESAVNEELEIAFYANDEVAEAGGGVENEGVGRARRIAPAALAIMTDAINKATTEANAQLDKANR